MVVNDTAVFIPDCIFPDAFLFKTNGLVKRDRSLVVAVDMQFDPLKYFMYLHPIDEMQKQFFANAAPAPVFCHAHGEASGVTHPLAAVSPAVQHADNIAFGRCYETDFIRIGLFPGNPETLFPSARAKFWRTRNQMIGAGIGLPDVTIERPGIGQARFAYGDLVAQSFVPNCGYLLIWAR